MLIWSIFIGMLLIFKGQVGGISDFIPFYIEEETKKIQSEAFVIIQQIKYLLYPRPTFFGFVHFIPCFTFRY